ncbi:MAG TPA: 16S rRNA (cytidine(1402)-2'-O)-methyltransferase [Bacteroidetes bacterium]|nr:16S rRNA (cytidine(1402)-2'-O)-methyltransferase [Bacteroidota bacterium]
MLYLVPTPIGNLKDITLRAIEVLQECDIVLAEDTRTTKKLFTHYNISTPLRAYHAHNEHKIVEEIINLLAGETSIALVTDAGTPAISDPGYLLVRACHDNGIKVISLPGASALTSALAASGLPSDKFHFEGFLPHKKGRNKRWEFLSSYPHTIVFYESPFRIIKLLKEICNYIGEETKVTVVREISKIYEESVLDTCKAHLEQYLQKDKIKGEFVVIVNNSVK